MKHLLAIAASTSLLLACAGTSTAAPPDAQPRVLRRYSGGMRLEARKEFFDARCVMDERRWGAVWQILAQETERPKVDFAKEIVLIGIQGDENRFSVGLQLDDQGDLTTWRTSTLMGFIKPTMGSYELVVVSREGIKTVNGQPLKFGIWRNTSELDLPLD